MDPKRATRASEKDSSVSSIDAKLDRMLLKFERLENLPEKVDNLANVIGAVRQELKEQKDFLETSLARVTMLEEKVVAITNVQEASQESLLKHEKDINILQRHTNFLEQQGKAGSARLIGFPVSNEEVAAKNDGGAFLRTLVYQRILSPMIQAAVDAKQLDSPLSKAESISKIYRAGPAAVGKSPPPIIIFFTSPAVKSDIFRFKKAMPSPNPCERSIGAKRFFLVDDLTKHNHRLLKNLQANESVDKVWSTDGQIKFIKKDDQTVYRVRDTHASFDEILRG